MNAYVFPFIDQLTDSFHSGGGLVIIASGPEQAREVIAVDTSIQPTVEDWATCVVYPLAGECDPRFFVFPDAGCC